MQQESLSLLAFQKRFRTEKLVRNIFLSCVWPQGIGALAANTTRLTFIGRVIYMPAKLVVTRPR